MTDPEVLRKAVQIFYGNCHGVVLKRRGITDPHICIEIIEEDDDYWSYSKNAGIGFSSYWLTDLQTVLKEATNWMDANAVKDRWGYSFK